MPVKSILAIAAVAVATLIFLQVGRYAESIGVKRIPERSLFYHSSAIKDHEKKKEYVSPILFPLDLVVMLLLTGAFIWASMVWWPKDAAIWPILIFPLTYLLFDLIEDGLLILMLSGSWTPGDSFLLGFKAITAVKLAAVILSFVQVIGLFVYALVQWWTKGQPLP